MWIVHSKANVEAIQVTYMRCWYTAEACDKVVR